MWRSSRRLECRGCPDPDLHLFLQVLQLDFITIQPSPKLIMKTYFCILIALCLVLMTVQAAELSPRARRQSDNLITLNIPRDLLDSLLKALLGEGGVGDLLKTILGGNGGGK
ncbi:uncharacterized protein TNIN_102831 [Trichonephila inaurata madagascariensis]|uniref:Uncharacterized protein n=1 Tax=Trichonephila inaurata madagascariensis TaxID=2747483 RepID=A0A8X7CF92_9ARAC|nr:uncharacterized protein TNIN_102831 [Trichonephila inaurata madagascariensis]